MDFESIQARGAGQDGDFVHDKHNPIVGGRVIKKLKTRVKVYFCTGIARPYTVTYDKAHCKYLVKE
jgi:hypothetical protein